ncbi:MAG: carbohydrate ABC transporter permease [Anaerolineae bacterium]|nr:carbohydrate ABC transporter permease [Anaerolineae bacterium]
MMNSQHLTNTTVKYLSLLLLLVLLAIVLLPFGVVVINSFKTPTEYVNNGPMSLPQNLNWDILFTTWQRLDFTHKLWNSFIIATSVAILGLGLSLFNSYALGIGKMRGRVILLIIFLMANTLPQEALAYPLYYLAKFVGLYNTQLAVILVFAVIQSAFGTYLLSSMYSQFPREILEAALMDGSNKLQLLFCIIVPVSTPTISVLFVFFFIWTWNEFFLPMVLLPSTAKQTVPLAIAVLQGQHNMDATASAASALLGILPCILFFILFQRTLTKGITAGSVK